MIHVVMFTDVHAAIPVRRETTWTSLTVYLLYQKYTRVCSLRLGNHVHYYYGHNIIYLIILLK